MILFYRTKVMKKKDTKVIGRRKKEHFGGIMDLFAVKIRKKKQTIGL